MNRKRIADAIFLVFSLCCLYLFFRDYALYLDISMADETVYMQRVLYKFKNLLGSFAPFYTLTYKFFHLFIQDYIDLHHFAIISLSWVPSVGLYFFLRSKNVPFFIASYLSWCLLFSSFNMAFDWWPRISHYSLFIIFIYFIFINYYTKEYTKIFVFTGFFSLFMAFVRPEFMMSSYAFFILGIISILYQKYKNNISIQSIFSKREYLVLIFMVLTIALLIRVWHSPMYGGRMYYAMGQHYTFNTIKWNKQDRLPFIHWEEIFKNKFGNSQSVGDMYKANPDELKKHITENINSYISQTLKFGTELFFPKRLYDFNSYYIYIFLSIIFSFAIIKIGIKEYLIALKKIIYKQGVFTLCALILIGPSIVASVIIFPREHYYILQLAFYYYLIYILIQPILLHFEKIESNVLYSVLCMILVFFMLWKTPKLKEYPRYNSFHQYEQPNYVPYIKAVRDLNIKKPTTFLVSEILPIYMNDHFKICIQFLKNQTFDSLMHQQDIGMMYISDVILKDYRFYEDSTWNNFINNYPNLGWEKLQLPNRKEYIIYKKDLLENENSTK
jgi:hypothetical protein